MGHFGLNPFPRRFGGGKRYHEIELEALLDGMAPGWDTAEDSPQYAEAYMSALGVAMIWTINRRVGNQMIPAKMLESLPTWEQACRLRPSPSDTVQARRRAVAAKFRGIAGNALGDIYDACERLLGPAFDGIQVVPDADQWTYWPGINPGPPGFEWSSNRAHIGVVMNKSQLDEARYLSARSQLLAMVDGLIPDWMTFAVGVDDGSGVTDPVFVVNVGIVGETML